MAFYGDTDALETQEWQEAFDSVIEHIGTERAAFLLQTLYQRAISKHVPIQRLNTPYLNTVPVDEEPAMPGDQDMERRIRALIRWNALAMVLRANKTGDDLGGHLASFASSATLYDVGFNHFFRAASNHFGGDMIYYQGHCAPGIYARSFLEGRLTEDQLNNFRREVNGNGLPSYPHPYLMPDYWQFPTVSMGLGPIMSIYQAHIQKYLMNRGLIKEEDRKVWAYLGDGEMDEPESLGAISLAGREKLDNLIWVVNCNLQRLDGPVRGNGKIIQELESLFRGAGWRVIKVVWGRHWDPLLAKDKSGALKARMEEAVDGDFQRYQVKGGGYAREHFFGKYPESEELVKHLSDDDIDALNRGGHDPYKVYAAYAAAMQSTEQPTVILAKTVKGYGLSDEIEAVNKTHQIKKMQIESLKYVRNRFNLPFNDEQLEELPFYRPAENSPELKYLKARRESLGGYLPARRKESIALQIPELSAFDSVLVGSGTKEQSTTMVMVRLISALLKDKALKDHVVPIVPDEARTFGLEGMFRQLGIYAAHGQKYIPEDNEQLMNYREAKDGHMLQEGINEAGAMSAWAALGTSYSTNNLPMIPMYMYYSMFGFQRIGDIAWAAGDAQAQGFLFGATAGRTTLNGEGLQHQDGHSHILAGTIPNCVSYDPCFGYELAIIIHDGLQRMYVNQERVFYYLTLMNENYTHPEMPQGVEDGIKKGMYLFEQDEKATVQLLGSGVILREVIKAAKILRDEYQIHANVWSVTSYNELARDGMACEEYNRKHPLAEEAKESWVSQQLREHEGIVVSATDHIRLYSEQIRAYLPEGRPFVALGTDGYGRSDTRENLRSYFEVDAANIVVATLKKLSDEGEVDARLVKDAISSFELDIDRPLPWKPQAHAEVQAVAEYVENTSGEEK
ncbi:pyruvate dehydrogenase (acetyl-transferring), homodimeric type [Acinetobacter qingfengensis]|uniref:Pyruvate dehydrogenase E1 component n=1 Tax=Acinetobacter qingfengensis TaxID=1262585 RepID=A0A1E7QWR9_9GAMM|nr:pyruvate dehydrogenase (acetyl-transferring), homodimeric type [Acinetobacter qingfengensis]KAA8731290.1 pyruvate dehydrogenase (acetyl-transferring), homodimeric type [Acinetobacter qingfengensis]OEY91461.1 pyruvate dehydrogenase (acetyl-transferring), homodimeric type [Acinetobacter qingfengensis]